VEEFHGKGNRGKIADMLSIKERPREVASRSVPGHREGDLILELHRKTGLGTLVEHTTRYTPSFLSRETRE